MRNRGKEEERWKQDDLLGASYKKLKRRERKQEEMREPRESQ